MFKRKLEKRKEQKSSIILKNKKADGYLFNLDDVIPRRVSSSVIHDSVNLFVSHEGFAFCINASVST